MVDLFLKGGILMYPLLVGSILAFAVIVERLFIFSRTGIRSNFVIALKEQISDVYPGWVDTPAMKRIGPLEILLLDIMAMRHKSREELEKYVSLRGDECLLYLEKNLHFLELTGRMAPMLGLLGTVIGMVEAFKQVAFVKTVADPSVLAGGIWEALITTVFGLIVGIPALIAHHLFTVRLKRIAFYLQRESEEIISLVKDNNG